MPLSEPLSELSLTRRWRPESTRGKTDILLWQRKPWLLCVQESDQFIQTQSYHHCGQWPRTISVCSYYPWIALNTKGLHFLAQTQIHWFLPLFRCYNCRVEIYPLSIFRHGGDKLSALRYMPEGFDVYVQVFCRKFWSCGVFLHTAWSLYVCSQIVKFITELVVQTVRWVVDSEHSGCFGFRHLFREECSSTLQMFSNNGLEKGYLVSNNLGGIHPFTISLSFRHCSHTESSGTLLILLPMNNDSNLRKHQSGTACPPSLSLSTLACYWHH